MSVKDAYAGANPYYDDTGSHAEYNMNCQRCVVAYELRRRGYDVVALPTYQGDNLPRGTAGGNGHWMGAEYNMNCQRCVVAYELRRRGYDVVALPTYQGDNLPRGTAGGNGHWMGAFKGARSESVGATRNAQVEKNIAAKMNAYGPGSRAVVRVQWQGRNGGGHVFSVENSGGRMRYVDAQTGKPVNIKNYLGSSKPSMTQLVRVDNLRVSERAKKSVTKARS